MRFFRAGSNVPLTLAFLCAMSASSHAQDSREKGNSILCIHLTFISMLAAAKTCFPERDSERIAVMETVIGEMDSFVLRNHPDATPETLAAFHERHAEVGRRGALEEPRCQAAGGNIIAVYEAFKVDTPLEKLRELPDTLLAVDRVPTINPCF